MELAMDPVAHDLSNEEKVGKDREQADYERKILGSRGAAPPSLFDHGTIPVETAEQLAEIGNRLARRTRVGICNLQSLGGCPLRVSRICSHSPSRRSVVLYRVSQGRTLH